MAKKEMFRRKGEKEQGKNEHRTTESHENECWRVKEEESKKSRKRTFRNRGINLENGVQTVLHKFENVTDNLTL